MKSYEFLKIMLLQIYFFFPLETKGSGGIYSELAPPQEIMARVPNFEFVVDNERCFGCAACVSLCPVNALELDDLLAIVDEPSCTHCNYCIPFCPVHALSIIKIL